MRAVEIHSKFGIRNLRVAERKEPKPGPGEVMIRVQAVSLNYRDLGTVKGINYPDMELPRIPCSDGAGEIVAVGEGVDTVRTGDRVMGLFMPLWLDGMLTPEKAASSQGGLADGMAVDYRVLPATAVVPVPDYLTIEEAATLPCAALTAWNALFENRTLSPEDTVLIRGTGGVAIWAMLLARAHGCRILATTSEPEKRQRLIGMGVDGVCNYQDEDWVEWATKQTEGRGVDVIVDSVGGQTLNDCITAARMSGYIALMGVIEGVEGTIRTANLLRKNLQVQGIYVGSREMFVRMNTFLTTHRIHPHISHTFPVNEVQEAFRCMENGRHFGKIVVTLD